GGHHGDQDLRAGRARLVRRRLSATAAAGLDERVGLLGSKRLALQGAGELRHPAQTVAPVLRGGRDTRGGEVLAAGLRERARRVRVARQVEPDPELTGKWTVVLADRCGDRFEPPP